MGVELTFAVAGGIILIGVLANLVAKKFGVPDVPLLIGLGILLGPVTGLIQASSLNALAPTFAALAITIIVFEGGIHLRLARVASQAGRATILTVAGYMLSVVSVALTMSWLLGWPLIVGTLLGSALGGSSNVVVFALLKHSSPSEKTGALLSLESSLTNIPVLVVTLSLIPLVLGMANESILTVFSGFFQSFIIGGVIGVAGGVAWLKMLDRMQDEPYRDIATIGFLLGAYAISEAMNGSGVMCALIIGLIMGNGKEIRKLAKLGDAPVIEGISKTFHEQISFALSTFFFVYLGLFFSLADPTYFLLGGLVSLVLFASRYLAVVLSTTGNSILKMDTWIMTVMFPRGLSNAVMAQAFIALAFPLAGPLVEVLLSSILWSVIASSVIVFTLPDHLTFNLKIPKFGGGLFPHVSSGKGPHPGPAPAPVSFASQVRAAVMTTLPGVKRNMGEIQGIFGSFRPTLTYGNGTETVMFDALTGQAEVSKIPGKVKACQVAKVSGSLNFVIDDLTAYRYLSRLLLVEEYCRRSKSLAFEVHLYVLDQRKRRLVPLIDLSPTVRNPPPKFPSPSF